MKVYSFSKQESVVNKNGKIYLVGSNGKLSPLMKTRT